MAKLKTYIKDLLKKSLIKNASYLISGSVIVTAINFVFVVLATRLFAPEQVGLSTAAISAVWLISTISEFGLGITLIRFLPEAGHRERSLVNFLLTCNIFIALMVTAIFILGMPVWAQALLPIRQNFWLVLIFMLFAISTAVQPILLYVFLAKRRSKFIVLVNFIISCLKLLVLVILALWFKNNFAILLAASAAAFMGMLLMVFYFVPKVIGKYRFIPTLKHSGFKELLRYSITNYLGSLFLLSTPFILPLIVIQTLGTGANAVFYVVWSVYAIIQVIPSAIFNSLFAEASNKSAGLKALTKEGLKFFFLLIIPAITVILLVSSHFLLIFGNSYSEQGTTPLRFMVLAVIPWGINYCYVSIARYQKQTSWLITVACTSLVISLLSIHFFMQIWGLTGAAVGYLAGQGITMILSIILIIRVFNE